MRMAHLVFLFACIAFPMYMIGYTSPLFQLFGGNAGTPQDANSLITTIASNMFNTSFALNVILLAIGFAALTGFSAVFLIPALIASVIVNLVLIPNSFLLANQCSSQLAGTAALCLPSEISFVLTAFLNLIVFLAVAEYIAGR